MDNIALSRRFDLHRRASDRVIAGVAGGLADRLGIPSSFVRAGFVVLSVIWGLGVVLYLVAWAIAFDRVEDRPVATIEPPRQIGLGFIFLGCLLVLRTIGWWPGDPVAVVATTLAFGVAVLADFDWLARLLDPDSMRPSKLRLAAGAILLVVGLGTFGGSVSHIPTLGTVTTAVLITLAGVMLVFGPWLVGMGRALTLERRERIRQEERAEVAAHLHDSVLQTLALMQRTDDPRRMVTLARQQERELRSWLYGGQTPAAAVSLKSTLEEIASRVENDFAIPVEVVVVGDIPVDNGLRPLAGATGEAVVNAAKHSGAEEVSVYAEVGADRVDVWVADMGRGFDSSRIPTDRRGIADSIQARMRRAHGGAEIESVPGEGTEVHLWVPRPGEEQ